MNRIVDIIKPYCEQKKEIIMAFLFGSYASDHPCKESDIDIAVYMKNEDNDLEIEIQNKLEHLIGKEIDLVSLQRSSAVLSWDIIRKGIPLVIKDRRQYLDFMLEVSGEAQDFLDFNLDSWRRKNGVRTSR